MSITRFVPSNGVQGSLVRRLTGRTGAQAGPVSSREASLGTGEQLKSAKCPEVPLQGTFSLDPPVRAERSCRCSGLLGTRTGHKNLFVSRLPFCLRRRLSRAPPQNPAPPWLALTVAAAKDDSAHAFISGTLKLSVSQQTPGAGRAWYESNSMKLGEPRLLHIRHELASLDRLRRPLDLGRLVRDVGV